MNGILYSANPFLKYWVQQRYRGDVHYVWCSEAFDSSAVDRYSSAAGTPPTSNPIDIYWDLFDAVNEEDRHNAKIVEQRAGIIERAIAWEEAGLINEGQKDDIIFRATNEGFKIWRPLLYVISRSVVADRIEEVPAHKCAGIGPEFVIADLRRHEFDIIELTD